MSFDIVQFVIQYIFILPLLNLYIFKTIAHFDKKKCKSFINKRDCYMFPSLIYHLIYDFLEMLLFKGDIYKLVLGENIFRG